MKRILLKLVPLMLIMPLMAAAQKDTLRFDINGNEVIILTDDINKLSTTDINGMVKEITRETQKITNDYNQRVAELNRQLAEGKISEEAYEAKMEMEAERFEIKMEAMAEMMEVWSEAYSEEWEEWAEEYSESWEEWAEKWEEDAGNMENEVPPVPTPPEVPDVRRNDDETTIIIGPDGIRIEEGDHSDIGREYKNKYNDYRNARTVGQGEIHFGWNTLLEDGQYVVIDEPGELRPWQSTFISVGSAAKTRIGGRNSVFYIRYGLRADWSHFRLKRDVLLKAEDVSVVDPTQPSGAGVVFASQSDISAINPQIKQIDFSSFNVAYLDIPIMFILDFSRHGVDEGFSIGVGGYGGVRFARKRDIIYQDFDNDHVKQRIRDNFYMNQWRYGLQAQVGIHAFKITGKYDLNTLFRTDRVTPTSQIASVSFGFSF